MFLYRCRRPIKSCITREEKYMLINNTYFCYKQNKYTFLPPATKLRQGNVFTPVCQSFCSQGGLCLSMHHRPHDQGVSLSGGSLSGGFLSRESLSKGSLSRGSLSGRPPYGNKRALSILLECILVYEEKKTF